MWGMRTFFTSDNRAGVCPEAWEAMAQANSGHVPSYGDDAWTKRAADMLRELFETNCDVYFAFNGTAANSMALATITQPYQAVVCHETSHVETDECGAPEFFGNGTKLLLAPGELGKMGVEAAERVITKRTDIHYPKPRAMSLSNSTELGTVYSTSEVGALCAMAKRHGLHVHMDGARFANAVASLGCTPAEITWKAGVDVLCFGGTKNGMAIGEAVVFFDRELSKEFAYRCKQSGQLASKMRFLAAPWVGMLENDVWLKYARHANAMAKLLERELTRVPGVRTMFPVQANALFCEMPVELLAGLKGMGWQFYNFIGVGGARMMTCWDTTEAHVSQLMGDIAALRGA
jgi:threonine aldolase